MEKGAKRILAVTAERVDFLVLFNDYKGSEANLERRVLEQDEILKAMKALVKLVKEV